MIIFTILGVMVVGTLAIMFLASLPWDEWWCAIKNDGHEYVTSREGFLWLTWTGQRCKHCGKYK